VLGASERPVHLDLATTVRSELDVRAVDAALIESGCHAWVACHRVLLQRRERRKFCQTASGLATTSSGLGWSRFAWCFRCLRHARTLDPLLEGAVHRVDGEPAEARRRIARLDARETRTCGVRCSVEWAIASVASHGRMLQLCGQPIGFAAVMLLRNDPLMFSPG
jgi:hypothetical protein